MFGSITDDRILAKLPADLEYAFHLACFHGNQSSIADPFAAMTTIPIRPLNCSTGLKDIKGLKKVVYAAAACAVAEKTYDSPTATTEDQPLTLYHDSPYSISKIIGELYGNFYFQQHKLPFVKARFSNVFGPREILGAGHWRGTVHTVWRNVTPTFILARAQRRSLALGQWRQCKSGFHLRRRHGPWPDGLCTQGPGRRHLQFGRQAAKPAFWNWPSSSTSSPATQHHWICARRATGTVQASDSPRLKSRSASLDSPQKLMYVKVSVAP